MPKLLTVRLAVPSNSRPEKLKPWLNKLLADHKMEVHDIADDIDYNQIELSLFKAGSADEAIRHYIERVS